MVALFGKGPILQRLKTIITLTKTHAFNLGRFVFGYKVLVALLRKMEGKENQIHSFLAAFSVGYFVFGEENGVNTQVNPFIT